MLDLALLLDLTVGGASLVYDPRVVFSYRRHAASVSSVLAADGDRFIEESAFFDAEARRYAALGWSRAERAAKVHLTSRLHHGLAGYVRSPERSGLCPATCTATPMSGPTTSASVTG